MVSSAVLLPLPEVSAQTTGGAFDISKGIVSKENIGCDGFDCQLCHVVKAADNLISFMFYLATVVAVLLFVYAGAKMMMAGGDSGAVSKAKEIFWNVIIGVIIMLCAYLVVDTVLKTVLSREAQQYGPWNRIVCVTYSCPAGTTGTYPNCTSITSTCPVGQTGTPPNCTTTPPPTVSGDEKCTRDALAEAGIGVNKSACPSGVSYRSVNGGCTSVAGLPKQAIDGLIKFKNDCRNCTITLTGGSEGGHQTHGVGRPMIDISSTDRDIFNYLEREVRRLNGAPLRNPRNGHITYQIDGATVVDEGDHYHIIFATSNNDPIQCGS